MVITVGCFPMTTPIQSDEGGRSLKGTVVNVQPVWLHSGLQAYAVSWVDCAIAAFAAAEGDAWWHCHSQH